MRQIAVSATPAAQQRAAAAQAPNNFVQACGIPICDCNLRKKSALDDFVNGRIKRCSAAQAAKKID